MENIPFELIQWQLNTTYNRVKNCMVVKPPYENAGYYSNQFFLDKRLWLEELRQLPWEVVDDYEIDWIRYYLVHNYETMTWSVYCFDWLWVAQNISWWFTINLDSPKKFAIGKWLVWPKYISTPRTIIWPEEWTAAWEDYWSLIPNYAWWYIKFQYDWVQNLTIWDYIVWRAWALLWWINRIEYVDSSGYVYIIWTNSRWTVPTTWMTFDTYLQADDVYEWDTLLVWHSTWVKLIFTDWINTANSFDVLSWQPIKDLVNFDWNIFALTNDYVFFSRTTYEDNTQFYPLDRFQCIKWEKLFPMGKVMLLFAWSNKLFVPIENSTTWDKYVWYDVNYQWDIFSKYSMIFDDQTIYILQSDKQLKKVDITPYNSTSYSLTVSDVLITTKWLFSQLDWWEIYMSANQRYLNFLYVKDWTTINYQYDKMYNHFIEQYYDKIIYKFWDHILSSWQVFTEWGYTDDWEEYEQEVNFLIDTSLFIYKPYILRTIFWLIDNLFDVNLKVLFELWARLDKIEKRLNSFDFDNRLSDTITWDELLENTTNNEQVIYDWSIASIQSNLLKVWRYIKFTYHSYNRFMLGNSYVITDKSKIFINEPLFTN